MVVMFLIRSIRSFTNLLNSALFLQSLMFPILIIAGGGLPKSTSMNNWETSELLNRSSLDNAAMLTDSINFLSILSSKLLHFP